MLKLSKTAIRELSKMYRAVLMGAIVALIATSAQAADGDLKIATDGTVTGTNASGTEITLNTSEMLTTDSDLNGAKLTDGSVDITALSTAVQTSLGKADSALQKANITTGTTDGTISVDGTDVAVKGLGSAAYTDSTAYATAAQGALADTALQKEDITTGTTDGTISVDGTDVAVKGLGSAAYTNSDEYATAAQGALADSALQNGDNAQFNTLETTGNATIGGTLNAGATTVGSLTTTGSATVGSLTTAGEATVNGTLTATDISANGVSLGQAEVKSGTTVITPGVDGYLEVNGTDGSYILLNGEDGGISANYMMAYEIGSLGTLDVLVEDTSQTDGYRSVFEADNSGNITNEGTITSGGLITAKGGITTASTDTSTGTTTYADATLGDTNVNGDITNTGTITSEGLITANGGLTVKNGEDFTLGGTAVNAIDDGTSGVIPFATTPTASTTLATVATVSGVASSLSAGLATTNANIGNLNYSSTNYIKAGDNLTKAVSALDSNLYRLEEDVDEINKEMKAGFASVAALSALQPNARAFNDTQISMGVGNYRGQTGFALGGFHYVNDNLMMNVGAAYAGDHSATFRGGLTFGW